MTITARAYRLAAFAAVALLCVPGLARAADAADEFKPQEEFKLKSYVDIEIGPLDLSINKAVIYLWIASAITILFGIFVVRGGLKMRSEERRVGKECRL